MADEKTQTTKTEETEEPEEEEQDNTPDLIVQANAAAERMENANKETAKLLKRQEALQVEKSFGGTAQAGTPGMTAEEKAEESAKKLLEGTGLEDYAFPAK